MGFTVAKRLSSVANEATSGPSAVPLLEAGLRSRKPRSLRESSVVPYFFDANDGSGLSDSSALKTCLRRSFKFCERINASRLLLKTRRNLRKMEGNVDTTGAGNARDGATFFF